MTNNQPGATPCWPRPRSRGEPVWQLPMYTELYDELIKSEVADIKNVGEGRWGGAITAAKFLEQFVGDTPVDPPRHRRPLVRREAQTVARRGRHGLPVAEPDPAASHAWLRGGTERRHRLSSVISDPRVPTLGLGGKR